MEQKKKKSILKIVLIIVGILCVIAIGLFGYYRYLKNSLTGTYKIQAFQCEYSGIELKAEYEDEKWETSGVTDFLKNFWDVDSYLSQYGNDFAYVTVYEDGTYDYNLGGITKSDIGDKSNSDSGTGNYKFTGKGFEFQYEDGTIKIEDGKIIITSDNYKVVFQKEK